MPDVYRYTIDSLSRIVDKAIKDKIPMIALFPHTEKNRKNAQVMKYKWWKFSLCAYNILKRDMIMKLVSCVMLL